MNPKYILPEPTNIDFEKVGIKGKIFSSQDLTNRTEFVLIETDHGHDTTIRQKICDFCYYILDGDGYFLIDGEKHSCKKGDLIVIPSGKAFTYKGCLKMLLTVTPPWSEEQEETLD
jgi:mannose-6-phosphate isomerase-like protein (cupin superfamily)